MNEEWEKDLEEDTILDSKWIEDFQSQDKDGCYNHINYYIGQGVRYICFKQIEYTHNSKTFKPFKHFVLRDSHSNMISQNDAEIIKAFNSVTEKNKIRSNLLPSNIFYKQNFNFLLYNCFLTAHRRTV